MAAHGRLCVGRGRGWGILLGAWQLAAFRVSEGLDAQLGRFAFDMGNLAVSALDLGRVTARTGPSAERLQATETAQWPKPPYQAVPRLTPAH